jgi:hypothetical protein
MGNEQKITIDKAWKILFAKNDIVSRAINISIICKKSVDNPYGNPLLYV